MELVDVAAGVARPGQSERGRDRRPFGVTDVVAARVKLGRVLGRGLRLRGDG